MEFIESPAFTKYLNDFLSDDEYAGLQSYLAFYPEAGVVVPGSGGVRKLRWDMPSHSRGKSGGCRIIYLYKANDQEIWLLTIYGKNEKATIPAHVLRKIAQEFRNAKS